MNGERITPTTAIIDIGPSILVNSAYLAPPYQITALGPKDLYARLSASPGFVDFIRARAADVRHPGLVRGAGDRRHARVRRDRDPALRATPSPAHRPRRPASASRAAEPMRRRRNQLTIAAVAFVLGPARRRPAAHAGERRRPSRASRPRT